MSLFKSLSGLGANRVDQVTNEGSDPPPQVIIDSLDADNDDIIPTEQIQGQAPVANDVDNVDATGNGAVGGEDAVAPFIGDGEFENVNPIISNGIMTILSRFWTPLKPNNH
ncbi:unnamed protein product [Rhizoctonia solani]|uniref:Uncharacterized protein n=1 Tax=Rhizoctonia solani TaxID=456999 RepID=A0A8H2WBN8_9AGAM|nr:unnamed protein product [Rhizoctonia solani]